MKLKSFSQTLTALCAAFAFSTHAAATAWQPVPQSQLAYLQLEQGAVLLLLADTFTPTNTAQFRQLIRDGYYNGASFYRVIDQFVLQAGYLEGEKVPAMVKRPTAIKAEFSWPIPENSEYTLVQTPDLLAKETGFRAGFAVGRDGQQEWLVHCPNVVNFARNEQADSASGDIAIMQGQAPRHLDRNMSVVARVIWGHEALNAVRRGDKEQGGMLEEPKSRSRIVKMSMGSDLPASQQMQLEMLDIRSDEFQQQLTKARKRENAFYHYHGNGQLDVCYQQIPVRLHTTKPDKP